MVILYYTPPSDECFEELKKEAIALGQTYKDPFYVSEKVGAIQNIKNIKDNFMYILAMFDQLNQAKVIAKLSEPTKDAIRKRLVDGGGGARLLDAIGL